MKGISIARSEKTYSVHCVFRLCSKTQSDFAQVFQPIYSTLSLYLIYIDIHLNWFWRQLIFSHYCEKDKTIYTYRVLVHTGKISRLMIDWINGTFKNNLKWQNECSVLFWNLFYIVFQQYMLYTLNIWTWSDFYNLPLPLQ